LLAELSLQRAARPERALAHLYWPVGLFLAADPGEELVQVVDYARRHRLTP
jgi:hypothetical protein